MNLRITGLLLPLLLAVFPLPSLSETVYESGDTRVSLLELYTSEGCSSCPPADRWLSGLRNDGRLWEELVPVAFHVDYWNYNGWKDRFSSPAYSDRQRQYARHNNVSTVYTPGFLLNGREWRSLFGLRRLETAAGEEAGRLIVKLDGGRLQAEFSPLKAGREPLILNIAVLGFDLSTAVGAGENSGKTLRHDFTVLGYKTARLGHSENRYSVATSLPELNVDAGGKRKGIALWVNREDDLTPIQATGGWLQADYY